MVKRVLSLIFALLLIKETAAEVENNPTAAPVSLSPVAETCALEVTVDCTTENEGIPCDEISFETEPAFAANDCGKGVSITYLAKNVGSEEIDLTSWARFVNGDRRDLLVVIQDPIISPGDSFIIREQYEIDICTNVFYCLGVNGQANAVGGFEFDANDGYEFWSRGDEVNGRGAQDKGSKNGDMPTCSTEQTCTIITAEPTSAPTADPFTSCVSSCEPECSTERICSKPAQRRSNCVNKCAEEKCGLPSNETEQEEFLKKVAKQIQQSCFVNIGLKVPSASPTFVPTIRPTTALPTAFPSTSPKTSRPSPTPRTFRPTP